MVPQSHIPYGSVGNAQPKLHERWLPKPNPFPRSTQRARFNLALEVWLEVGPSATQRLILYTEANGCDVYCLVVSIWQDPLGVYHVW